MFQQCCLDAQGEGLSMKIRGGDFLLQGLVGRKMVISESVRKGEVTGKHRCLVNFTEFLNHKKPWVKSKVWTQQKPSWGLRRRGGVGGKQYSKYYTFPFVFSFDPHHMLGNVLIGNHVLISKNKMEFSWSTRVTPRNKRCITCHTANSTGAGRDPTFLTFTSWNVWFPNLNSWAFLWGVAWGRKGSLQDISWGNSLWCVCFIEVRGGS